jgi:murein DD-endopeptidase MepM/ murein hydrolase activator NlpD
MPLFRILLTLLVPIILSIGCQSSKLPDTEYAQYNFSASYKLDNDQLEVSIGNPLLCPLRVWIQTEQEDLKAIFDAANPYTLPAQSDTLFRIDLAGPTETKIVFASRLGDEKGPVNIQPLALPFPKNRRYKIIQGVNSTPTHNSEYSRYAVDFGLQIGDTVTAAADGFVVGVIDQYEFGGEGPEWRPFSNFITLFHPQSGLFTQYVHLSKGGVFVELGEEVKEGQAIGLAGMTGQTNIEHLHFNVLVPVHSNRGVKSVLVNFTGYFTQDLKRGDWVEH